MYLPPAFVEDDLPTLHRAIRDGGLATVISAEGGQPTVSHLPLYLAADEGAYGTLYGHMAKANGHGAALRSAGRALAVFLGPNAYIHPGWYPGKARHGKVVPTWNYVAVHAEGPVRMIEDPAGLRDLVSRLTDRHEAGRADPWRVDDAPADYLAAQLKAIVGFALSIERLTGKWKLSQNRRPEDQAGVVAGLRAEALPSDRAVADLMAAGLDETDGPDRMPPASDD